MCFHIANLVKKSECGTHSADKCAETFNLALNPPLRQTAVPVAQPRYLLFEDRKNELKFH